MIFTWRFGSNCPPPPAESELGLEDLAFRSVLEAAFHQMNLQVEELQTTPRNTPPPAAPDPNSKRFWRIRADWNIDSDGDGSPDWAEFEMMGNPSHPCNLLADAFNGDVDNNGVADGNQLDLDTDGTFDPVDPVSSDPTSSQPTKPNRRYALFPVSPVQPPPNEKRAFQINDRGTVLFENGTWSGGKWTELKNEGKFSQCIAYGINDSGEIVGKGTYEYLPESGPTDATKAAVIAFWSSPDANPVPLIAGEHYATPTYSMLARQGSAGTTISNDGRVIATSLRFDPDPHEPRAFPVSDGVHHLWTVPGHGGPVAKGNPVPGMVSIFSQDVFWGRDPQTHDVVIQGIGVPYPGAELPTSMVQSPDGTHLFTSGMTHLFKQGGWKTAASVGGSVDMSQDGAAISGFRPGVPASIVLNGLRTETSKVLPQAPQEWKGGLKLLDTTPNGWILAQRGDDENPIYGAMLPLTLEGNLERNGVIIREAVGVDAFSIGATNPGDAVKDRIWIMAPAGGGQTRVRLTTPIHSTTPLQISGAGLKFDGNDFKTITGPETEFTIQAADGAPSGTEVALSLKLGLGAGQAQSVAVPIAAKVMKKRVVRVRVWRVKSDDYPNKPSELPKFNPSNQEIETYLNEVYGPQINASFTCNDETVGPLGFDTADGSDFGGAEDDLESGNRMLNIDTSIGGEEISAIRTSCYVSSYNINLYLVGGVLAIQPHSWNTGTQKLDTVDAYGIAHIERRSAWIAAGIARPTVEGLDTIAHEIGHLIIGEGHPDEKSGPAYLPPTPVTRRLMCGGKFRLKDGSARLMVKAEWDKAEENFRTLFRID